MVSPIFAFPSEDTSQLTLDLSLLELLIQEEPLRNPEGWNWEYSTGAISLFPSKHDQNDGSCQKCQLPNFCSYRAVGFPSHPLITHTLPKEHGSNKQTGGKKSYNNVAWSWHTRCQNHYKPLYCRMMSFVLRGMLAIHRATAQLFQFLVLHKCPLIMSRGFCL